MTKAQNSNTPVTRQDLEEVVGGVRKDVEEIVTRVSQEMLGAIAQQFAVRDDRLDNIEATVTRIENKLDATADKVDDHEVRLKKLEHTPA